MHVADHVLLKEANESGRVFAMTAYKSEGNRTRTASTKSLTDDKVLDQSKVFDRFKVFDARPSKIQRTLGVNGNDRVRIEDVKAQLSVGGIMRTFYYNRDDGGMVGNDLYKPLKSYAEAAAKLICHKEPHHGLDPDSLAHQIDEVIRTKFKDEKEKVEDFISDHLNSTMTQHLEGAISYKVYPQNAFDLAVAEVKQSKGANHDFEGFQFQGSRHLTTYGQAFQEPGSNYFGMEVAHITSFGALPEHVFDGHHMGFEGQAIPTETGAGGGVAPLED